jgi:ATP-dependent Zn protease
MDDPTLISKQQLFARIVGGLGGRAAEEIIFGEPEITTGAAGDLQQITGLAKQVQSFHYTNISLSTISIATEMDNFRIFTMTYNCLITPKGNLYTVGIIL